MNMVFFLPGVRLGGGFRVATERRCESCALHPVRGADRPPERGDRQDGVLKTVRDQRRKEDTVHYHVAAFRPMYVQLFLCRLTLSPSPELWESQE